MKYIVFTNRLSGYYLPVVFPDEVVHAHIVAAVRESDRNLDATSAGFVHADLTVNTWAVGQERSDSTGLNPAPEDQIVLNLFLKQGLSGLALANMLAFIAISAGNVEADE